MLTFLILGDLVPVAVCFVLLLSSMKNFSHMSVTLSSSAILEPDVNSKICWREKLLIFEAESY